MNLSVDNVVNILGGASIIFINTGLIVNMTQNNYLSTCARTNLNIGLGLGGLTGAVAIWQGLKH